MKIVRNIDPLLQAFGISLFAAVIPLLMMADVLSYKAKMASIIVGLFILGFAWADDVQPGQKFHVKFTGNRLYAFIGLALLLIVVSLTATSK